MSEKRFDSIDKKMDDLKDEMSDLKTAISTGFAVYNQQLEIHIKGTNENKAEIKQIKEDLEPIKDRMKFAKTLLKLVLTLGTIAGMVVALLEYLK